MSVSAEDVVLENEQTLEEHQEVVTDNNVVPEPSTPENNQETGFDFEKSKAKLEYISIIFALVGLISTGLVKVLSLGRYLCFYFDINNCEFKLTNTDFIILFFSLFCCGSAILYCYITNSQRVKINSKVTECLDAQAKIINKIMKVLGFGLQYFAIIFIYLIVGCFIIYIVISQFSALAALKNDFIAILSTTLSFVIFLSCFTLKENKQMIKFYTTISAIFLLLIGFVFIKSNYDGAINQKEFEIITLENNNETQTYAIISRGSSYSAYQCSIDKENNILTINTDVHHYFPLDDTETKLYVFESYQLEEHK